MPRLDHLTIDPKECIHILCDGNPGAIVAMVNMYGDKSIIDPDSSNPILLFYALDDLELYGDEIHIFFKNISQGQSINALALMRADQMGQLAGVTKKKIIGAVKEFKEKPSRRAETTEPFFDFPAVIAAVQEKLPNFGRNQLQPSSHP